MNYKIIIGIIFISLGCFDDTNGQEYQRYKDLDGSWYYFDDSQRHRSYELSDNENEIFLTIDRSVPDSAYLRMVIGANTSIFINKKIVAFTGSRVMLNYRIDSLFERYNTSGGDQLTIMLQHKSKVRVKSSAIVRPAQLSETATPKPYLRSETNYENVLIVLILILLSLFTYIKIDHGDIWRGYMKWSRILLSHKDQGDNLYKMRPFEKGTVIIIFAYAVLGATAILGFFYLSAFSLPMATYFQTGGVLSVILKWLILVFVLLVLAYGKYFLVKSFTRLFDFKRASRIHFYNHIRMSMVILIALMALQLIVIFGFHKITLFNWFTNTMVILLLLKSVLISMKLIKISTYRMFHLFSYLCATEIIPAIILVKITFLI